MNYKGYEDTDLIPELKEYKKLNGEDFGIDRWLSCNTTTELFIGFSDLFYPEFEEYLGGVFFAGIEEVKKRFNPIRGFNRNEFEKMQRLYNHQHILDFFIGSDSHSTISPIQVEFIGKTLCNVWAMKLKQDFPHLDTRVELYDLDSEYLDDVQITFWAEPK